MSRGCRSRQNLLATAGDRVSLCYGSISLFTTILHNVFILYHIEMFLNVFKINKTSFWIGESLFLLWNSFNDPLFGWIGDKSTVATSSEANLQYCNNQKTSTGDGHQATGELQLHHRKNNESKNSCNHHDYRVVHDDTIEPLSGASAKSILKRTLVISACGPLLAVSFLLLWFDWMVPSIQFAVCLCLYDAFLTIVDLHHSALLADLSTTSSVRTSMNTYESVFSAIGSSSVFLSYMFWDKQNLTKFRIFCVILAIVSAIGFYIMSKLLQSHFISQSQPSTLKQSLSDTDFLQQSQLSPSSQSLTTTAFSEQKSMRVFIRQLLRQKNFLMFTIINIIQVSLIGSARN